MSVYKNHLAGGRQNKKRKSSLCVHPTLSASYNIFQLCSTVKLVFWSHLQRKSTRAVFSSQFYVHIIMEVDINAFMHPCLVQLPFFMWWRKTSMSNKKREAKQSWSGELWKSERAVVLCRIHDWRTKARLVVYPQNTIMFMWNPVCAASCFWTQIIKTQITKYFRKNLLHIQKTNSGNFCDTPLQKLKLMENCYGPKDWKYPTLSREVFFNIYQQIPWNGCLDITPNAKLPTAIIPNVTFIVSFDRTFEVI